MSRSSGTLGPLTGRVGFGAAVAAGLMVAALIAPASCGGPYTDPDPSNRPPKHCPAGLDVTASCTSDVANRCLQAEDLSTCEVSDCQCQDGQWDCEPLHAVDGEPCGDSPMAGCPEQSGAVDGSADDARSCTCGADHLWSCTAAASEGPPR